MILCANPSAQFDSYQTEIEEAVLAVMRGNRYVLGEEVASLEKEFADNLVTWADVIRKTFFEGGVDELISTRRLDHIVKAYAIFDDKMKSIELCVARFDEDTKESFMDLYTKIDAGVDPLAESTPDEEYKADESDEAF